VRLEGATQGKPIGLARHQNMQANQSVTTILDSRSGRPLCTSINNV